MRWVWLALRLTSALEVENLILRRQLLSFGPPPGRITPRCACCRSRLSAGIPNFVCRPSIIRSVNARPAAENLVYPILAADYRLQILDRQARLLHSELDSIDCVRQVHREMRALVRLDQRRQYIQAVAFR